ncbi:MAG: DUF305 domain-containing protein [Sulfurovaceae bacterium]|nr:DUF305 domain-containing protein [Sulfurovaceae bacterium]
MKKELLYGIVGLLIGAVIAIVAATLAVNNNNTSMMKMMGMYTSDNDAAGTMMSNEDMSMGQMMAGLQGKTGDNFDKAFLSEMIVHHQGAINMANLAKTNAKHDEIKNMANDIVVTQTKEINQMQTWQTDWGY